MAVYDDFAWFYNRYWNKEFHTLAFPILERIWLRRLPPGASILDICCGTGYLAGLLARRGYRVAGIDASAEMIRYARQNVPEGDFRIAEAASFRAKMKYDAAVCTFDSLNHLLEASELEAAFRNTAAVLHPGALFAFDMLLDEAYKTHWGESFALVREDHVLTITGSGYDSRRRLAFCTITMFRLIDGSWHRSDVVVEERCYDCDEIREALGDAGFRGLVYYSAGDLGMGGQLGEGRIFFVVENAQS